MLAEMIDPHSQHQFYVSPGCIYEADAALDICSAWWKLTSSERFELFEHIYHPELIPTKVKLAVQKNSQKWANEIHENLYLGLKSLCLGYDVGLPLFNDVPITSADWIDLITEPELDALMLRVIEAQLDDEPSCIWVVVNMLHEIISREGAEISLAEDITNG